METQGKTLWELLWEYDPNGLVVVDTDMTVKLVNTAFCEMFRVAQEEIIGQNVETVMGDSSDFRDVWESGRVIKAKEKEYPEFQLYVRKVMFPIRDEGIIACIVVDVSHEWHQRNEILRLKRETVAQINQMVDGQMHLAQEIAGLLGETTAETKVSLLKLREMLEQEIA